MITSYNGWPASKDQAEIGIVSVPIEGTKLKVRCAKAVAPLIAGYPGRDSFSTQVSPTPSPLQNILGIGSTLAGIFSKFK